MTHWSQPSSKRIYAGLNSGKNDKQVMFRWPEQTATLNSDWRGNVMVGVSKEEHETGKRGAGFEPRPRLLWLASEARSRRRWRRSTRRRRRRHSSSSSWETVEKFNRLRPDVPSSSSSSESRSRSVRCPTQRRPSGSSCPSCSRWPSESPRMKFHKGGKKNCDVKLS